MILVSVMSKLLGNEMNDAVGLQRYSTQVFMSFSGTYHHPVILNNRSKAKRVLMPVV